MYAVVHDSGYSNQFVRFYRQSGARVYQYGYFAATQEQLLFDFSRAAGDTIASFRYGIDTCTITLEYRGSQTIFGMNRPLWVFLVNPTVYLTDDQTEYAITDSLGITSITNFSSLLNASGVLINGRMFGTFTSVSQRHSPSPDAIHLYQNYPNPFNPTTTIPFKLSSRSNVTLQVYDILGREVAQVINGPKEAGAHSVAFDSGTLASGVYYYQLNAAGSVQIRKMIVQK